MFVTIKSETTTGPMTLFLMAVIGRGGLNTLYALQRKAELQPGSIRQVLEHLVKAGLLNRSEVEQRGHRRRTMELTEAGEALLEGEWKNNLDAKREMESVLRGATVALLMNDIGEAMNFLHRSAFERVRRQGPRELGPISPETTPMDLHAAMREVYESRRREMEADVLRKFADNLMEVANKREGKWNCGVNRL